MEDLDKIKMEVNRCLNCKNKPCKEKGCPLGNDIPSIIENVKKGNLKEAFNILSNTNVIPSVTGRICPHEKQCMGSCTKGIKENAINIGNIEAYLGDIALKENYSIPMYCNEKKNKKIAVIGSGPAGLSASAYLARSGFSVTIYEKHNYLGGLLAHGIPDFRLPQEVLEKSIQKILDLGIKVELNKTLGENLSLKELEKEYDAIFIACGANKSTKMNIEGENLNGVYGGNELLENKNHPSYIGKRVSVIGGGNVAIDVARTIKKLGAKEVNIIYRRSQEEMPAEKKEIEEALKENINLLYQNNIVKIIGKDKVEKIELIKTELKEKERERRKVPVNIENSNYIIDMNYVIMAIGAKTEDFVDNLGLEIDKYRCIKIDEENRTSNKKVFAGGDIVGQKATVAWAAKSGINAAKNIEKFLLFTD